MKKSTSVSLVLITATLASCDKPNAQKDWEAGSKTYVRSDSTAPYHRTGHHIGSALLWYYAFRPVGGFVNGHYRRSGFYSGAIPHSANVGKNSFKSGVVRGGFGRSGARVSS